MDYKTKYSCIPRRRTIDTNYQFQPKEPIIATKSKLKLATNIKITKEDRLIQKLDMCEKKIDEYFMRSTRKYKDKENLTIKLNQPLVQQKVKQHQSVMLESKQKTYDQQEQKLPVFNEYRLQPYIQTLQNKSTNQRRYSYNSNINESTTEISKHSQYVRPSSIQRLDEIPSKISDHFQLNYTSRSNFSTQLDKRKTKQAIPTQRLNQVIPKFQNIQTINNLNNQISQRMNRMMKSFK